MADGNDTYVVKRRDLAEIIRSQQAEALADFFDEPLISIAEAVTGLLAAGPLTWGALAGRLVQSALKARLFQQVSAEIKELREKGKIAEDYAEKKYGFQSWVELLTVIDTETPDEDRLEALKAMFFAINRTSASDGERIVAYQLFQIAKALTSGQLLVLKACYEMFKNEEFKASASGHISASEWLISIARNLGHEITGLIDRDSEVLVQHGLLSPRLYPDRSGVAPRNAGLTDLGIRFCRNLETYNIEKPSAVGE